MEYLIVGGGLAGLSLAWRLKERGVKFKMIEHFDQPSSTEVATGMYNPVVFKRLNLSWMIDDLLPEIHTFYSSVENQLNVKFNHPISYIKRIRNEAYQSQWEERRTEPEFAHYFGPIADGYGNVLNAGMIDCNRFKTTVLNAFIKQGLVIDEPFDYLKLILKDHSVEYKDTAYSQVVFCEGPYAVDNPYFNWLPFKLCRGEWIVIETVEHLTTDVINNRINIIPIGQNQYKISSTYHWDHLNWETSSEAREELIAGFKDIFDVSFKVVDQQAGIRPTVADRRPYLGRHPEHPQISIFNGLGSKGVMLTPYFSKHLISHLEDTTPLLPEVDIQRHIKRFQSR